MDAIAGMVVMFVAQKIVEGIATVVDRLIETKQEIIEAGEAAKTSVQEIESSFNDKKT